MRNQKGFSLIELLIVVAIIGIIAAIAIPALLQARIAANESAVKGDSKALVASNATYASQNNQAYATDLTCLANPQACPNGAGPLGPWAAGTAPFLDVQMGAQLPCPVCVLGLVMEKKGFVRTYNAAAAVFPGAGSHDTGSLTYTYIATATAPGQTGNNNYTVDHSGLMCNQPVLAGAYPGDGQSNPAGAGNCVPI